MTIHFGTDGWRAVISEEFTFDNVRRVAQAIAEKTLADVAATRNGSGQRAPSFVVGYDTRFLSDRYAIAVAEVLAANGIHVWLTHGDSPTPVTSFAIVDRQADGGVMITASHNPPRYNGIKLKAAFGGSASPADCKDVERRIVAANGTPPQRLDLEVAIERGLVTRFDPFPAYTQHVHTLVDFEAIRQANLSVAVDAMYGAGRIYLRKLLEEAGCRVVELRSEMNPGFNGIHPEPIARHLGPLIEEMLTGEHWIGLATDGDADRIGAVDPTGRFIDPHAIMALLIEHLVNERNLRGSVVKTVSTTQMLNRLALRYGLPIYETPVGFNHITDYMLSESVLVGGEESGGISILGHIPEGDGLLMGMLLVEMVAAAQADAGRNAGRPDGGARRRGVLLWACGPAGAPVQEVRPGGGADGQRAGHAGGRSRDGREQPRRREVYPGRRQLAADPAERHRAGAAHLCRRPDGRAGQGAAGLGGELAEAQIAALEAVTV